jgi:3-deoxy-D-manno-octulosonate 8-phosphate phosphatase (KDO 8-P phosphatase)
VKDVLADYPKGLIKKARDIKAIFFDVDGVLTDGKIMYDDTGKEWKHFNVKDGQIISHLKKAGIIVGAISGRESGAVTRRAAELKFDFCHQGILDKPAAFSKMAGYHKLRKKQVVYIGDDINDTGVFDLVGISVCPADSPEYIKKRVDLITFAKGGEGVLREVADLVLAARGSLKGI